MLRTPWHHRKAMLCPHPRSSCLTLLIFLLLLAPIAGARTEVEERGDDGAAGQDGEPARAAGVVLGAADEPVDLQVTARGGNGGPATAEGDPAGDGGDASLGAVYGRSETGEVVVVGEALAGRGGSRVDGAPAGDGGEAHLQDAVDGDTAGPLRLEQRAIGGSSGVGPGGVGGAASSHLFRSKSAESLELQVQASGGGRALFFDDGTFVISDFAGAGAPAAASSRAQNDAGPATVLTVAAGGSGGVLAEGGPAAPGGDAEAWASAATRGDGNRVQVGHPFPEPDPLSVQPIFAAAIGGPGGSFQVQRGIPNDPDPSGSAHTPNLPGGDGGNASSFSMGMAHGRSRVEVYDTALGGPGGSQIATFTPVARVPELETYIDVGAGAGGEARSVAVGLGGRGELVRAVANARGGSASNIAHLAPLVQGPDDLPGNVHDRTIAPRELPEGGLSNTFIGAEPRGGFSEFGPGYIGPFNPFGRRTFVWLGDFGESGGPAHAKAQAVGSGPVEAVARADGGGGSAWLGSMPRSRHEGGNAHAAASGTGRGGSASAQAGSNSATTNVKVGAATEVVRSAQAEAKIAASALDERNGKARGRWRRLFRRKDASARAVVDPTREAGDALLAKAPEVAVALGETAEPNRPALGRWSARQSQWSWREHVTTTLTLELRTERNLFDEPIETYRVVLLSPELSRWGFEELRVRLHKDGEMPLDEAITFTNAAAARAWLDGQVIEVGTLGGVEIPFPWLGAVGSSDAAEATVTIAGSGGVPEVPGGVVQIDPPLVDILTPLRAQVATLTIELDTSRPGAGLELDFLVSTTPVDPAP